MNTKKRLAWQEVLAAFALQIAVLLVSALALVCSFFAWFPALPFDPAWVAILLCGLPIVREAVQGLWTSFDIKTDVLVALALIAALCIRENFAAGEVALIMRLGALLEEMTVAHARAGIEHLVQLTPRQARLVTESGEERQIPAEAVQKGDQVRVLPGESIPVDGVILRGQAAVEEAVMTGEPLPVDKGPGDEVMSGTVCAQGSFDLTASRVGEDSAIQRMIRLVQSADAGKAKIVRLADRWATWIVVAALLAALCAWLFTGDLVRAVTVLVVFCPCSLVLATPTAITAAIGNAARSHFLVRAGDALERLASVARICFDKTGTLTKGEPAVQTVESCQSGFAPQELLVLAAAAEARSEHPLGRAIAQAGREQQGTLPEADSFVMLPGQGVGAVVQGRKVLIGTRALLASQGATVPDPLPPEERFRAQGCSLAYLALDGKFAGFVVLADVLRPDAAAMIAALKRGSVQPVLLTGDQETAARYVADSLGIAEVQARCLPEDKLRFVTASQQDGKACCMIGDGINDAPALKAAQVGIAVRSGGGLGTDLACEAADIVLVRADLSGLPHLVLLARRMMRTIRSNLIFSMVLNFAAIALAMTGVLNPVTGALVHNAGSVFVIVQAALLLSWREEETENPAFSRR